MTPQDLSELFGLALTPAVIEMIQQSKMDFTRRVPDEAEQRSLLLQALKHADNLTDAAFVSVDKDLQLQGWNQIYAGMARLEQQTIPPFLVPKPGTPIRIRGRYEIPTSQSFEFSLLTVLRSLLFPMAFSQCAAVHEFGCGSGHNLWHVGKQLPGKALKGYEWSTAALEVVRKIEQWQGLKIETEQFDLFDPTVGTLLPEDCGVLTVGALEQTGVRWKPWLDWLLQRRPKVVLHIEPIVELYNDNDLFDYVALRYHRRCGFLQGYLPELMRLNQEKKIEVHVAHKIPFGAFYHDAYTYVAWSPL